MGDDVTTMHSTATTATSIKRAAPTHEKMIRDDGARKIEEMLILDRR